MSLTLWTTAIATWGIGDVITTQYGLERGVEEAHPVMAQVLDRYGTEGMIAVKLIALGVFLVLYFKLPKPNRLGVPIGLILLGVAIIGWNLAAVD